LLRYRIWHHYTRRLRQAGLQNQGLPFLFTPSQPPRLPSSRTTRRKLNLIAALPNLASLHTATSPGLLPLARATPSRRHTVTSTTTISMGTKAHRRSPYAAPLHQGSRKSSLEPEAWAICPEFTATPPTIPTLCGVLIWPRAATCPWHCTRQRARQCILGQPYLSLDGDIRL
jgi:hypothetical protein